MPSMARGSDDTGVGGTETPCRRPRKVDHAPNRVNRKAWLTRPVARSRARVRRQGVSGGTADRKPGDFTSALVTSEMEAVTWAVDARAESARHRVTGRTGEHEGRIAPRTRRGLRPYGRSRPRRPRSAHAATNVFIDGRALSRAAASSSRRPRAFGYSNSGQSCRNSWLRRYAVRRDM